MEKVNNLSILDENELRSYKLKQVFEHVQNALEDSKQNNPISKSKAIVI